MSVCLTMYLNLSSCPILVVILLFTLLEKIFSQQYFLDLRRSRNMLIHGNVLEHRNVLVGWNVLESRNVLGSSWPSSVYKEDFHSQVVSGVRREAQLLVKWLKLAGPNLPTF